MLWKKDRGLVYTSTLGLSFDVFCKIVIVKSILQWRERQSESFGERILQALKGPCGSSTPHSACVFHTRSNCSFADSFHAQQGNVTIKTPQDSQHPRARAVYIGNAVIPCQCVVKYQPKVFMCPDLSSGGWGPRSFAQVGSVSLSFKL